MKRILSALLLVCLAASLLCGCAAELPPLPTAETPSASAAPEEGLPPADETPAAPPEPLELVFELPRAEGFEEELAYYFSTAEEFDGAFAYPAYCAVWVEKGAIRFDPGWFFARMFFTSVLRGDENAPGELLDLLEPGKWNSLPEEGEVGTGWKALRAMHLKYDTWRDWVAWETPDRYYLLYGACFDGREEALGSIFETIAASFRRSDELLVASPESGALLWQNGSLALSFDSAAIGGGSAPHVELRLYAENRGEGPCTLTAGGEALKGDAFCFLGAGGATVWTLDLPLSNEEDGGIAAALDLTVNIRGAGDEELLALPVHIEVNE